MVNLPAIQIKILDLPQYTSTARMIHLGWLSRAAAWLSNAFQAYGNESFRI
jgi:hypothetical protein